MDALTGCHEDVEGALREHENHALKHASNLHVFCGNENWCAIACIYIRKPLQIHTFKRKVLEKYGLLCAESVHQYGHQWLKNIFSTVKVFLKWGEIVRRQRHTFLEQGPIETWPGVLFAARGNVLVPCDIPNGVMLCQRLAELA